MKFKKQPSRSHSHEPLGKPNNNRDKVVISSEYYQNERPSYLCSFCNQTLIRLTDAGQNNSTYWCRHCSIEFNPEDENLRKESKLIVPDRNSEAAVTSIQTNMADEVEIRHTPEIRGGLAELQKKGLKIKNYHTTEKE
jgi:DNA-directed RNA polymerase subunit RPC12/RpoP